MKKTKNDIEQVATVEHEKNNSVIENYMTVLKKHLNTIPTEVNNIIQNLITMKQNLQLPKNKRQGATKRNVNKLQKDLMEELKKHHLSMEVEIQEKTEVDNGYLYKSKKEYHILAIPRGWFDLKNKKTTNKLLEDNMLELDNRKLYCSPRIFEKNNIPLVDFNGNIIAEGTENVLVMICPIKELRILHAIYQHNLEKLAEGNCSDLILIQNVQEKEFETIEQYIHYLHVNCKLDRSMKKGEEIEILKHHSVDINKVSEEYPNVKADELYTFFSGETLSSQVRDKIFREITSDEFLHQNKEIASEFINMIYQNPNIPGLTPYIIEACNKFMKKDILSNKTHAEKLQELQTIVSQAVEAGFFQNMTPNTDEKKNKVNEIFNILKTASKR